MRKQHRKDVLKNLYTPFEDRERVLNPIKDGLFWSCSWMWGGGGGGLEGKKAPLPKICHKHPALMKLDTVISYLKKI